jgi:hypothetical protein
MSGHSHQVTNVLVEIGDGRAVSESYVTVHLRTGGERAADLIGRGRYLDRFEHRDGRWAIVHRRYVADLLAVLPGAAEPGRGGTSSTRRDRTDPSYELLRRA